VLLFLSLLGTPAKYLPSPLVYLGRISYGLYALHITTYWFIYHVWKEPIRALLASAGLDAWYAEIGFALAFAMTVLMASASYRWFERPFLRLKRRFTFIPSRGIEGGGDAERPFPASLSVDSRA
jgi:peptidoglycan/LPS O-acetylase OafA/YrhL